MQKYKYLVKNLFLFFMSGLFVNIISFVLLPVYTSYLTTEEYAVIDLVTVTQQLLFPVLSLSLCEALLRFIIESREEKDSIFCVGFVSVVVSGAVVIFLAPVLQLLFSDQVSVWYFVAIYILMAVNQLFANYSRAIDKVKLMTAASALGNALTIVLNIFFIVILGMQLQGYLTAYIIGQIVILCMYLFWGKLYREIHFVKPDKELVKKMIRYAIPLIPNSLFWWINSSLDRYFLRLLCEFSIVGLYAVASKIPAIVTTLTNVFQQAWNLSAFREFDSDDRNQFYSNIYFIFHGFVLCSVIVLVAASEILGKFLFSKDFFEAWKLVPWLVWGTYINALNSFLGGIFTAKKDTGVLFVTTGVGAVLNCILNYILIRCFGGAGAAIATCCSYIAVFIARSIKVRKIVELDFSYGKLAMMQFFLVSQIIITIYYHKWTWVCTALCFSMVLILYGRQLIRIFFKDRRKQ